MRRLADDSHSLKRHNTKASVIGADALKTLWAHRLLGAKAGGAETQAYCNTPAICYLCGCFLLS
jgi:hypothetical protein